MKCIHCNHVFRGVADAANTCPHCGGSCPAAGSAAAGWIYHLQCTVCGMRVRRHKNDYPGKLGDQPKATLETECSNCTCQAGYPAQEVRTLHFIDYSTDEEIRTDES